MRSNVHYIQYTSCFQSYTLAFAIAEPGAIECLECGQGGGGGGNQVDFKVCARPEAIEEGMADFACSSSPRVLDHFDLMLFPSSPYPISKMDLLVPPNKHGAMENWGLLIFAENLLLYQEGSSGDRDKKLALTLISHEIAHQVLGD